MYKVIIVLMAIYFLCDPGLQYLAWLGELKVYIVATANALTSMPWIVSQLIGLACGAVLGFWFHILITGTTPPQDRRQLRRRTLYDRRKLGPIKHIPFYDAHGNWIQYDRRAGIDRRTQPDRRLDHVVPRGA
jgi:hypothetical protein